MCGGQRTALRSWLSFHHRGSRIEFRLSAGPLGKKKEKENFCWFFFFYLDVLALTARLCWTQALICRFILKLLFKWTLNSFVKEA